MNKRELIKAISSINRTATPEFLAEFSERDLSDYMSQLTSLDAASMGQAQVADESITAPAC